MNMTSRNFEEKRNFIRMKVDTPVTIRGEALLDEITGICRDLSGGGLLVEVESTLPVGTVVDICIASQHSHSPILKARVEICRVISGLGTEKQSCLAGMEIVEML